VTDYGFTRVSSGSQDAATQRTTILRAFPGAQIISMDGGSASASKGEHLDALESLISRLKTGDRVVVTDSSRLDRRDR
jgi:DNA invertase Pin-like site-specific DNA recombinase